MTTLNWKDVTPEFIRARAKERKENARNKAARYKVDLLAEGFTEEKATQSVNDWLQHVLQSWDDFERDQLRAKGIEVKE